MKLPDKKRVRIAAITGVVFIISTLLYLCGIFSFLENKSYDYRVKLFAGINQPSEDIFVIVLDQNSLDWAQREKGWSWPWPRSAYADMVRYFNSGNAYSLTFDVLYTEPSLYGTEDDTDFAQACAEFGGVVQTVFFSNQNGNTEVWPNDIKKPIFEAQGFSQPHEQQTHSAKKALFPIPMLAKTAVALGNITGLSDSDTVIRRNPLFYTFDGMTVPGLALAAHTARSSNRQKLIYNPAAKTITFGEKTFPATPDGSVLLRFRKSIDSYIPYSALEILQSYEALTAKKEPLIDPQQFEGKYIFFCFYAPGLFDICSTPISNTYPGAGVHITMLDNFLQNDFIASAPLWAVLTLIALSALFGVLVQQFSIAASVACVPAGTVLLAILAGTGYAAGTAIPFIAPVFALAMAFSTSILISYNTESRQRRYIKAVFRQYLSPAVIEQLIAHPERVKLGGELREISIFFSDVQGFTSISERLSPEALTELLNDYLSAMSDIILASGGTIDKYEGDAIIAFWNAPLNQNDHARRALEAALECQRKLATMGDELAKRAGGPLFMRIGLNTGKAVVGNMGSHSRFDYTMLGDSVNLAARLEGLNKQFGTYTMCTEAAVTAAKTHGTPVQFRELSRVAVVGKKETVTVFEPLDTVYGEKHKNALDIFNRALVFFYNGNFEQAGRLFESIQHNDPPARHYVLKCRELASNPPQNWNGVWQATSK